MANSENAAAKREARQYWTVDIIDSEGIRSTKNLTADQAMVLENQNIVLPFRGGLPRGEAGGLLGRILGNLAKDCTLFPIGFDSWPLVPRSFKERVWNDLLKPRLWIEEGQMDTAYTYILSDLGTKWRNSRINLWNTAYKPEKSREENITAHPAHIPLEQWAMFIDYRLRPETQEMCKINAMNKAKHDTPHTGGSQKNSIKKDEMEAKLGREVSRGEMFMATHVKPNGSYNNAKSAEICEKIAAIEATGTVPAKVSRNDSLAQVLGKEHPGRTRTLGSGVAPTQAFGYSLCHRNCCSSSIKKKKKKLLLF